MDLHNRKTGQYGEELAANYLKDKGYKVLKRNFRTRFAELDIICKKNDKLIFVEVKTRIGDEKGKPYEAVDGRKVGILMRACQCFLLQNPYKDCKLSIDVISIILNNDNTIREFRHFENIFGY